MSSVALTQQVFPVYAGAIPVRKTEYAFDRFTNDNSVHTSPAMRAGFPRSPYPTQLIRGPERNQKRINQVWAETTVPVQQVAQQLEDLRRKEEMVNGLRSEHLLRRQRASAAMQFYLAEQEERLRNNGLTPVVRRKVFVGSGESLKGLLSSNPLLRRKHSDILGLDTRKKVLSVKRGADLRPDVVRYPDYYPLAYDMDTDIADGIFNHEKPQREFERRFDERTAAIYKGWA